MVAYGYIIYSMISCNSKCFIMRKGWTFMSSPHSFPTYLDWIDFLNLCGLFMRLQEITYQIIGFKSNLFLPNQWIFLATQNPLPFQIQLFKQKTRPRKDNGKNRTLCQHFTCICHWKCGHVLYSLHAESNYCSSEAFFSSGIIIDQWGAFFNFGIA